jgi:hypothetical protein
MVGPDSIVVKKKSKPVHDDPIFSKERIKSRTVKIIEAVR